MSTTTTTPTPRRKPRLLDLFCKAGGAAQGYADAGFEVTGVDIERQPHYPFAFIQADVKTLSPDFMAEFDAIHFSPPCQGYSEMKTAPGAKLTHPMLIPLCRAWGDFAGVPYVIENVEGARDAMRNPVTLCGSHFDLGAMYEGERFGLQRHRLFETNWGLKPPATGCDHTLPVVGVYGGHVRSRGAARWRKGGGDFPGCDRKQLAKDAMGIDAPMTFDELSEAIPPAFTRYIGRQLMAVVLDRIGVAA